MPSQSCFQRCYVCHICKPGEQTHFDEKPDIQRHYAKKHKGTKRNWSSVKKQPCWLEHRIPLICAVCKKVHDSAQARDDCQTTHAYDAKQKAIAKGKPIPQLETTCDPCNQDFKTALGLRAHKDRNLHKERMAELAKDAEPADSTTPDRVDPTSASSRPVDSGLTTPLTTSSNPGDLWDSVRSGPLDTWTTQQFGSSLPTSEPGHAATASAEDSTVPTRSSKMRNEECPKCGVKFTGVALRRHMQTECNILPNPADRHPYQKNDHRTGEESQPKRRRRRSPNPAFYIPAISGIAGVYECDEPDCEATFLSRRDFEKHVKDHEQSTEDSPSARRQQEEEEELPFAPATPQQSTEFDEFPSPISGCPQFYFDQSHLDDHLEDDHTMPRQGSQPVRSQQKKPSPKPTTFYPLIGDDGFPCQYPGCLAVFSAKDQCDYHMRGHRAPTRVLRASPSPQQPELSEHTSFMCGDRYFDNALGEYLVDHLEEHIKNDHEALPRSRPAAPRGGDPPVKGYACLWDPCNEVFETARALDAHVKAHFAQARDPSLTPSIANAPTQYHPPPMDRSDGSDGQYLDTRTSYYQSASPSQADPRVGDVREYRERSPRSGDSQGRSGYGQGSYH